MGVQTVTATAYTSTDASTDAGTNASAYTRADASTDASTYASAYTGTNANAYTRTDTGTDPNSNATPPPVPTPTPSPVRWADGGGGLRTSRTSRPVCPNSRHVSFLFFFFILTGPVISG